MEKRYDIHEKPPVVQALLLALQHVFAMFGATVLVPILTGLDPSVALLTSGIGTLIFHLMTKGMVPAYLGSSFAYIAGIASMVKDNPAGPNVPMAMGAAFVVGLVYIVVFLLVRAFGSEIITRYVPSVVVGPVVMIIGLSLAGVALGPNMAGTDWPTAIFTLVATILISVFARGFFKVIPILLGIGAGYVFAIFRGLVDFSKIGAGPVLNTPHLVLPEFQLGAILLLAPLALVTIIEDLGHIFVIGNVTERDLIKNPGFDRVLLGNGLATAVAAFFGGPPSTTYGENIGVVAVTRVYSAMVIQLAAVVAIFLSFVGPVRDVISSIPAAVMGGVVILLFGMIAAAGIRTMIEARTDLSSTRNLIIVSIILVVGIGYPNHGVGYATIAGILLNLILPQEKQEEPAVTTLEMDSVEESKRVG
ncbi:MAG: NCS2 family nucleobase:cation symporter [Clostridia bacterium]|nr:NCS2 family nucleobase:cation symporter [Clostridia bacterium]